MNLLTIIKNPAELFFSTSESTESMNTFQPVHM